MKVILLDIDGVLNTKTDFVDLDVYGHPTNTKATMINRGKLAILELLVRSTDSRIVITSTWRETHTLDSIHDFFALSGWTMNRDVILDQTPIHRTYFSESPIVHRGAEISEWLTAHPEVESHLIIDDNCKTIAAAGFVPISNPSGSADLWAFAETIDSWWCGDFIECDPEAGLTVRKAIQGGFVLGRTAQAHTIADDRARLLRNFI